MIGQLDIDWHEADVEQLPFEDRQFDIVLSQFGHMFAPRPDVAIGQMLRVLKPRRDRVFDLAARAVRRSLFQLTARYLPPLPPACRRPFSGASRPRSASVSAPPSRTSLSTAAS